MMCVKGLVSIRFKVFTINIHNIPLHVQVFYIQFYFTLSWKKLPHFMLKRRHNQLSHYINLIIFFPAIFCNLAPLPAVIYYISPLLLFPKLLPFYQFSLFNDDSGSGFFPFGHSSPPLHLLMHDFRAVMLGFLKGTICSGDFQR